MSDDYEGILADGRSEFGRGLVINLVKFAEHRHRVVSEVQSFREMAKASEHPESFTEFMAVSLVMNGACDHLREIIVPESMKGTEIESMVADLKSRGIHMGSIFAEKATATMVDAFKLFDLAIDIAVAIDKHLGLDADKGAW